MAPNDATQHPAARHLETKGLQKGWGWSRPLRSSAGPNAARHVTSAHVDRHNPMGQAAVVVRQGQLDRELAGLLIAMLQREARAVPEVEHFRRAVAPVDGDGELLVARISDLALQNHLLQ